MRKRIARGAQSYLNWVNTKTHGKNTNGEKSCRFQLEIGLSLNLVCWTQRKSRALLFLFMANRDWATTSIFVDTQSSLPMGEQKLFLKHQGPYSNCSNH